MSPVDAAVFHMRHGKEVGRLAAACRARLPQPIGSDAVVAVEINRQYRLVVTTASGERFEVESRKESDRFLRTLAPGIGRDLLTMRPGVPLYRRAALIEGQAGIEFVEAGRE